MAIAAKSQESFPLTICQTAKVALPLLLQHFPFTMKFIANTSFLAAIVAAAMGPSSIEAIKLSSAQEDDVVGHTKISFKTPHDIVDTPESITIFEQAVLMSAGETHDANKFILTSEKVESITHSRVNHMGIAAVTDIQPEEAGKKNSLRSSRVSDKSHHYYADDEFDDDSWYASMTDYWNLQRFGCWTCFRAADGKTLGLGGPLDGDDSQSHQQWEADLCAILGQSEFFSGAYDCEIVYVDEAGLVSK
eukprot:scaffold3513_cov102-Cylindrotheca_fusiformis.AAC.3